MPYLRTDRLKRAILLLAAIGLVSGLGLHAAGEPRLANLVWSAGVLPALGALLAEAVRSLARGEPGVDIVAGLSMCAALAFGESLAAAVVAVMYSGGTFLESFAEGRARREMHALLARVPRHATRLRDGALEEVALDAVRPGDLLLIRQGDVVPVDGTVEAEVAFLDTSALTGESLPRRFDRGTEAMSGSTNAGEAFTLAALRLARDSSFAGIVRLVEAAQRSKAPMSRLADRWSLGFLGVTLILAGAAWGFSGDPVRVVAVLVVATPCPLILAVPVALVAGLSRAARFGILVKGAGALEQMTRIRTLILDKTGTLTEGRPRIVAVLTADGHGEEEVLRLAASLDQASQHPVAQAVVAAARARGLELCLPRAVTETPGEGVAGQVGGRDLLLGGVDFVRGRIGDPGAPPPALAAGMVVVALACAGRMAGYLVMADPLRADAAAALERLRRAGIDRILLATGDRADVAERVTAGLGLDAVRAGLSPEQKLQLVQSERAGRPVMMVGDGVNDAPALAAANVGVAMGLRGAAASAEAADVVLLVDRIDRLGLGLDIARAARRIALQSVAAGIGLSLLAMTAAACGHLSPVEGALLQEVIDVAVILNALRALRIARQTDAAPDDRGRVAEAA